MRLIHALPLAAALALAACGNDADDALADDALSMDEVLAAAEEGDIALAPGQYRTTQELISFDLPAMPEDRQEVVRAQFAEGAAVESGYCVTEAMSRREWVSAMAEADCSASQFEADGDNLTVVMQCASADGINGQVEMSGTASAEGSDLELRFNQDVPDLGDAAITMRVRSQRTGDCA